MSCNVSARPVAVEFAWVDPWTGEFCSGGYMRYTRERMARGFYRRNILAAKHLAKLWTGPRTPKLRLVVHRAPKSTDASQIMDG